MWIDKFRFVVSALKQNTVDITEVMNNPHFKDYLSFGLIDEISLRNAIIKHQYRKLKKNYRDTTNIELKFKTSNG